MTNKEILSKAIKKANKNIGEEKFLERDLEIFGWDAHDTEYLIFNHEFAKAFWGENYFLLVEGEVSTSEEYAPPLQTNYAGGYQLVWQFHLQQMVLEDDPIKYLAKFL